MQNFKDPVLSAFKPFALAHNFSLEMESDNGIRISGEGIPLLVKWSIERIPGIFVMLADPTDKQGVYGLEYLISFAGGPHSDRQAARSNDAQVIVSLVSKYAMKYLRGFDEDFEDFKNFVRSVASQAAEKAPTIKANKWIRPEWI